MTSSTLPLPGGPARPRRALPTGTAQCGALLCVLLINALVADNFFAIHIQDGRLFGSLIDILNRCAPVALLALGMTLVIATGGIDLSVGAVMAISGATMASLATGGHSLPVILASVIGVGLLCGLWNGLLVAVFKIQPIVATLILMVAGRGIAQLITEGQIITFNNETLAWIGSGSLFYLPTPVIITLGMALLLWLLTKCTALGLFIEAVGINIRAAKNAGLNTPMVVIATYLLSGMMAAVAGMIVAADIRGADPNAGSGLELQVIAAVVIGGTSLMGGRGSVISTFFGVLIISVLAAGLAQIGATEPTKRIITGAVIVIAVVLDTYRSQRAQRRN